MDLGISWEGVDRMRLTGEGDTWWAVVNTVLNLHVP
jgi:hypothetical protein